MTTSTLSRLRDNWEPRGQLSTAIAVIGAIMVPLMLLPLLNSTDFAGDFENGTHAADYGAIPVCIGFAVVTVIAAIVGVVLAGVVLAGERCRAVCGLILVLPALLLLQKLTIIS